MNPDQTWDVPTIPEPLKIYLPRHLEELSVGIDAKETLVHAIKSVSAWVLDSVCPIEGVWERKLNY
jgi:hypothetical protein